VFALLAQAVPILSLQAMGVADDGDDGWVWAVLASLVVIGALAWPTVRAMAAKVSAPPSSRGSGANAGVPPSSRRRIARDESVPPSRRRASTTPPNQDGPPSSRRAPPASGRIPRRVILLYSETPGQSRDEYNVGDDSGTRSSTLVRVA